MQVGDLVRHTYDNFLGLIIGYDSSRSLALRADGREPASYPWRVQFFDTKGWEIDWFMEQVFEPISDSKEKNNFTP